jgi:hypothetical protein
VRGSEEWGGGRRSGEVRGAGESAMAAGSKLREGRVEGLREEGDGIRVRVRCNIIYQ